MRRRSRSRSVSMDTCVYRGEGDDEVEIEVEVEGDLEPYFPGSYEEPPSGGGVDDIRATFWDGKKHHDIPLTDDEVATFAEQLAEQEMDDGADYEPPEREPYDDD